MAREYEVTIKLKIKKYWADIKDFEREIDLFNENNKNVLEAEIVKILEKNKSNCQTSFRKRRF